MNQEECEDDDDMVKILEHLKKMPEVSPLFTERVMAQIRLIATCQIETEMFEPIVPRHWRVSGRQGARPLLYRHPPFYKRK